MPKYILRYGSTRSLGVFTSSRGDSFQRGAKVIARTDRGLETAEVLCTATDQAVERLKNPTRGQILRDLSVDDENEITRMRPNSKREFDVCKNFITDLKLLMKLVDVEHLFGGERIVFYYLADQRVDFRELVKKLAGEFQTRIEMRQIGVRDESRLLADYGDCGKPVCCNTHLSEMPPVSMKMAKLQRATLDPSKISGRCGRLKCCLRYEYDTYVDMRRELPSIGSQIVTRNGPAKVLSQEIITSQLLVETEDHRRVLIEADEVLSVISSGSSNRRKSKRSDTSQGDKTSDAHPKP
ncbi:MAG: signal peptidase, partial [Planctomycetales bacterium]